MIRAVLDTNIVISAHIKADGLQALILGLGLAGKFQLCVSESLLEEYEGVLRRPRFGFDPQRVSQSLVAIRKAAQLVTPGRQLRVTRDPEDNKVLECALEAHADYVVTGNVRHFPARYRSIRVVRPREFITVLAAELD